MISRIVAIVLLASPLIACGNHIVSFEPVFPPDADAGEIRLHDGLWVGGSNCERAADGRWIAPEACSPLFASVMGRTMELYDGFPKAGETAAAPVRARAGYIIVKADVPTVQAKIVFTPFDLGGQPATAQQPGRPVYFYYGLRDMKRDAGGKVVAITGWSALCGPPPASYKPREPRKIDVEPRTDRPLEGVRVLEDMCVASSPETIAASLRASPGWDRDRPMTFYWVSYDDIPEAFRAR